MLCRFEKTYDIFFVHPLLDHGIRFLPKARGHHALVSVQAALYDPYHVKTRFLCNLGEAVMRLHVDTTHDGRPNNDNGGRILTEHPVHFRYRRPLNPFCQCDGHLSLSFSPVRSLHHAWEPDR